MSGSPAGNGTAAAVVAFNAAFGRGDLDEIMAMMTPDCVFESTAPPDGERFSGGDAVRGCFERFFGETRDPLFETEEIVVAGDRAVVGWRFSWAEGDGTRGHVRGVDLLTVRDDRVAEKRSYVKG